MSAEATKTEAESAKSASDAKTAAEQAAADAAVSAAYGSAGERCMAVSVVVAVGEVAEGVEVLSRDRLVGVPVGAQRQHAQRHAGGQAGVGDPDGAVRGGDGGQDGGWGLQNALAYLVHSQSLTWRA